MMTSLHCVFTAAQIDARVRELAGQIARDCQSAPIVLLVVLKGAILFAADLMRRIEGDVLVDFFVVSSYPTNGPSAGDVRVLHVPQTDLTGRHVILVDEIVDTGRTVAALLAEYLADRGAASVRVCTLLDKAAARVVPVTIDYAGFEAPESWLVGYGMDNSDGFGRNLPGIFAAPAGDEGTD
jgi:hypoxanthine phosphoribosyltransferase